MTLDKRQDDDEIFNERGLTFAINKKLFEEVKPVKIDYSESSSGKGFVISYKPTPQDKASSLCNT